MRWNLKASFFCFLVLVVRLFVWFSFFSSRYETWRFCFFVFFLGWLFVCVVFFLSPCLLFPDFKASFFWKLESAALGVVLGSLQKSVLSFSLLSDPPTVATSVVTWSTAEGWLFFSVFVFPSLAICPCLCFYSLCCPSLFLLFHTPQTIWGR